MFGSARLAALTPRSAAAAVLAAIFTAALCIAVATAVLQGTARGAPSQPPRVLLPASDSASTQPSATVDSARAPAAERSPAAGPAQGAATQLYTYKVLRIFPHDAAAFTQGLEHGTHEGRSVFWESTGMYGRSSVREVDPETGKVLRSAALPREWFGEGLTHVNGSLLQLTWRTGTIMQYDARDLSRRVARTTTLTDGWGIAYDPRTQRLLVTDSSTLLHSLDPTTLALTGSRNITDGGKPVPWVNELEFVEGELWGNVWQTPCIARIDPATARVKGWVLLGGLVAQARLDAGAGRASMDVLNGIAYDAAARRLYVTGKQWPALYEIEVVALPESAEALAAARRLCVPQATPF